MSMVIGDEDVRTRLRARDAVRWMGEAIDAHHRGELIAPPRVHSDFGDGRLVFTTGRVRGAWFGYRSYDTFPAEPGAQVVVIHDETSGVVRAVAVGNELGPRRVGAIGAVAADALAARNATVVGVIGAGTQAGTQLWALSAVRAVGSVRVFSRDPDRRNAFAAGQPPELHCSPVASAREAVDEAEIVILASNSPVPVIEAAWLKPDAYVATLGPKQRGRAEFDLDLAAAAGSIVTDSLAQIDAYDPPNLLVDTPYRDRLVSLGAVRAGDVSPPDLARIRLFCSVGLAGTEAFLLDRLVSSTPTNGAGRP